jgi:hypothetical protein
MDMYPVLHLLLTFKSNFHELEVRQINRHQTHLSTLTSAGGGIGVYPILLNHTRKNFRKRRVRAT